MNILTFDTSLDKTYVTLSSDSNILESEIVVNHNEKYHSAFLIPVIVSILKKHNFTMQNIDAIGTNIGPGSFTGIRACVTVARVMAQQLDIPLVGVSSLEVLSRINKSDKKTVLVLDARKQKYYTAVYQNKKEILAPCLTDCSDLSRIDFADSFVISDESSAQVLQKLGIKPVVYSETNENLGLFLNKIVNEKLSCYGKDVFVWSKLKPLYLQAPPVTLSKK